MQEIPRKIAIIGRTDWFEQLFHDCKNDHNIIIGEHHFTAFKPSRINSILFKIAFTKRKTGIWDFDCLKNHYSKMICKRIDELCPDGSIFIFNRTSPLSNNHYFLKKLRETNSTYKMVYWFTDIIENVIINEKQILDTCKSDYDIVVTYDPYDAQKYGFHYIETPYSYDRAKRKTEEIDLFYVGAAKLSTDPSRYKKIMDIFESANKEGLKTEFYIIGVPEELQRYKDKIHYNTYLPYREVIDHVCRSRCILEVQQEGERGTTLRLFEAIAYGKRLMVTGESIEKHPLFERKYMKLICPDAGGHYSIDKNFVLSQEPVKYNSTTVSELSPYRFIQEIDLLLKNK